MAAALLDCVARDCRARVQALLQTALELLSLLLRGGLSRQRDRCRALFLVARQRIRMLISHGLAPSRGRSPFHDSEPSALSIRPSELPIRDLDQHSWIARNGLFRAVYRLAPTQETV